MCCFFLLLILTHHPFDSKQSRLSANDLGSDDCATLGFESYTMGPGPNLNPSVDLRYDLSAAWVRQPQHHLFIVSSIYLLSTLQSSPAASRLCTRQNAPHHLVDKGRVKGPISFMRPIGPLFVKVSCILSTSYSIDVIVDFRMKVLHIIDCRMRFEDQSEGLSKCLS